MKKENKQVPLRPSEEVFKIPIHYPYKDCYKRGRLTDIGWILAGLALGYTIVKYLVNG